MSKKIKVLFLVIIIVTVFFAVLPAFQKSTRHPPYTLSLNNLRLIGLGLWMYAEDNNDIFPENLEQIEIYVKNPHRVFNSILKPEDFNGPSYIYVNGHSFKDAQAKEKYIIAYENTEYLSGYKQEQVNFIYLEGYSYRLEKEKFLSELRKTYEHLGKPMPEIHFKEEAFETKS